MRRKPKQDKREPPPGTKPRFIEAVQSYRLEPLTDATKPGPRRVSGIAKMGDTINSNRRFYSMAVLEQVVARAQDDVTGGALIGLSGHPDWWEEGPKGELEDIIIRFDKLYMDGPAMKFEGVVVATEAGADFLAVLDAGVAVGMSTQMVGSATYLKAKEVQADYPYPEQVIEVVGEDAMLITIDAVMCPADENGTVQADSLSNDSEEEPVKDLQELKVKYPHVYEEAVRAARADSSKDSGTNTLEATVAKLSSELEQTKREKLESERKRIASDALASANLPFADASVTGGVDLRARFARTLEDAAMSAESAETAVREVNALIAERRAITGTAKTDSAPVRNVPGLSAPKDALEREAPKQDAKRQAMRSLRAGIGL